MNYYNEFDPAAAQWIRNLISAGLIPPGDVDERSIEDVTPNELRGYTQCHFFAGIAGWSLALDLAGWPRDMPVWTGSAPCQPFSSAGKGAGFDDQRHLWPAFFHLIRECRPERIYGEQVASAIGHGWLDLVSADLEAEGYAVGATVLGAHSVGAPHIRQRLYFVADASIARPFPSAYAGVHRGKESAGAWNGESQRPCAIGELADTTSIGHHGRRAGEAGSGPSELDRSRHVVGELGHAMRDGRQGSGKLPRQGYSAALEDRKATELVDAGWSSGEWRLGADGKARLVEPKFIKMVNGVSCRMVPERANYGEAQGEVNGKAETCGPSQALRGMRQADGAEDVCVGTRGQDGVCEAQVLRSGVHGEMDGGEDKSPGRASAVSPVTESGCGQVRDMRKNGDDAACASQGRESNEQCRIELDDFVRLLSSSRAFAKLHGDWDTEEALLAVCAASGAERLLQYPSHQVEAVWRSLDAESHDIFRLAVAQAGFVRTIEPPLAHGIPARMVRLRAYGNSICPQTAAAFIRTHCESAGEIEMERAA